MAPKIYPKEEQENIQRAITFLVQNFNKTGHNSKPVIIHSIRVSMYLYNKEVDSDVVIGALLHDIVEDTEVTIEDIKSNFGEEVARLVSANSFKSEIEDYVQKYIETFERNIAAGPKAVLIKAADLLDNADYYKDAKPEMWSKLFGKFAKFVELSEEVIGNTDIWKELKETESRIRNTLIAA